jgi:hypothetical protein
MKVKFFLACCEEAWRLEVKFYPFLTLAVDGVE